MLPREKGNTVLVSRSTPSEKTYFMQKCRLSVVIQLNIKYPWQQCWNFDWSSIRYHLYLKTGHFLLSKVINTLGHLTFVRSQFNEHFPFFLPGCQHCEVACGGPFYVLCFSGRLIILRVPLFTVLAVHSESARSCDFTACLKQLRKWDNVYTPTWDIIADAAVWELGETHRQKSCQLLWTSELLFPAFWKALLL